MSQGSLKFENQDLIKQYDFRPLYKWLLQRYASEKTCPALLFFGEIDDGSKFLNTQFGEQAILLQKEDGCRLNNLKRAHAKPERIISGMEELAMQKYWDPAIDYKKLYTAYLEISDYLNIPMPAIFFASDMPCGIGGVTNISEKNDVVFDVFINTKVFSGPNIISGLLHELRHVWQVVYHKDWFEKYSETRNFDRYSNLFAEVDAFAFSIWNTKHLGFKFYDEHLENNAAIKKRIEELEKTETPLTSLSCLRKL